MGIVIGLIILSVMMIVHELGHFLTGRKLGFTIEEFAIFMGPVLFSWKRKGIKYSIKLLPIGASVRFAGEYSDQNDPDGDPGLFFNRPRWARAIVISTGPALNLLTGVLAFLIIFWSFGYTLPLIGAVPAQTQAATAGLQPGDRILRFEGSVIRTTLDYSVLDMFHAGDQPLSLLVRGSDGQSRTVVLEPAWRSVYRLGVSIRQVAGQGIVIESVEQTSNGGNPLLLAGDVLLAANGVSVADMAAFTAAVQAAAGETMTIAVRRNGQALDIAMKATLSNDLVPRGIVFTSSTAAWPAVGQAFQWTWSIVKATVRSIGMIFTGSLRPQDALSGPVGVVSMISDVVSEDQPLADKIYQLLWLFAFIAVSLGFMNLLPIPPLDGNHLVLIVVEAIRGRRLSARVQNAIGIVGIGLIVVLALAGLLFDILRLTAR